jgi:hypothetical protein
MFQQISAKWIGSRQMGRRKLKVLIASDRPDLMADAGFDSPMHKDRGMKANSGNGEGRDPARYRATWWMPFHATAG